MDHIFISYSSKDRAKTKVLAKIFEQKGWKVWWDKNIMPGTAFDRAISKALDEAYCIVVLWSPNSVESSWVLEEAYEGLQRQILVPALSGKTRLPFGYRRLQYADLTKWKGSETSAVFKKFLSSIETFVPIETPKAKGAVKSKPKKKPAAKKIVRTLSGGLDGKTIVFTGTLTENRNAHSEKVNAVGAKMTESVSGKTDYLVVGKEPGDVKLKAAEKHGTTQLTERKWLNLLNKTYKRTLENKKVVFTGKLERPRKELETIAKKLGAKPTDSISGQTDFLIVGDNPGKVKLAEAEKYSVKIIKESLWSEIAATL